MCLSFSASKAEVVTVPLSNGLSVTVTTGDTTLQNLNTNPNAVNVTMGDDSNVNVPLGFNFPYYGQTFNNSWMYSNGGVSFTGPNIPGGFCCSGLDITTLNNSAYNYSIVPLWADLIALQGGTHYRLGTSNSMTYGWYGVSEYADPSKRSTFEVKIDDTGLIDIRFSGALVTSRNVTSGFIGDITKSEYYQYYHGFGFNPGPFSYVLNGSYNPPPTYPSQCDTNLLYSTQCPGYAEALARSIANSSTSQPTSTSVVLEPSASSSTTTIADSPIVASPIEQQPAAAPVITTQTAPVLSTTSTTSNSVSTAAAPVEERSRPQAPASLIMSVIRNNQSNLQSIERNAVDRAVKEADALSSTSLKEAETIAKENDNQLSAGLKEIDSSKVSTTLTGTVASNTQINNAQTSNTMSNQTSVNRDVGLRQQTEQEQTKNESFSPVGRNIINDYLGTLPKVDEQNNSDNKKSSVNRNAPNNEIATGVDIAQMQKLPPGYDVYSIGMQDAAFYTSKEVYKNQKVIDNQRVLRQLNARSDRLHEEMVNGQFLK